VEYAKQPCTYASVWHYISAEFADILEGADRAAERDPADGG
jgi:hypothetical protein